MTFFLLCAGYILYLWYQVPQKQVLAWHTYSSLYKDSKGSPLRLSLSKDEKYRLWVSYEEISEHIIKATLMYEDKYFYSHPGVNFPALGRAFISTYITNERRVGASTITMQVARVAFNLQSKTILGKIQQIFYALWLEQHYSKEEILELYFNSVSYGSNIEGVEAASQIYFHKSASDLSIPQALSLVVIPQNPGKRNPLRKDGYEQMLKARSRLFREYNKTLLKENLPTLNTWMSLPLKIYQREEFPFLAAHFTSYLKAKDPFATGHILTTLDMSKQRVVEHEIKDWINRKRFLGINNAAAILLDKKSMEVKAWVGSADFYDAKIFGQVDGIIAKRSPGSTLKPFAYALAMDQGLIHPNSLLKDTPYRLQAYTPENYDRVFLGPITATKALISSRNIPAVRLTSQLNKPSFYEFLQEAQISEMKKASHYGMSIVLGGMETSLFELASLYGILANDGNFRPVRSLQDETDTSSHKLLSPESAYLTLDMLRQNPPVTQQKYLGLQKKIDRYAWKTGTSFAFRDALSAGLGDKHILVVWVGNFDGSANPSFIGREAAAPLFFNIFKALNEKDVFGDADYGAMLNLSKVDICQTTGMLPSKFCPDIQKGWFIPGVSPIDISNVYREIPIDIKTGLRACASKKGKTEMKVFEFWPSDINEIFLMAGIEKKPPPPYESGCVKSKKRSSNPVIQSPTKGLIYTLQMEKVNETLIPLKAILDADSHQAFWYINKSFVGKSESNEVLFWKPSLGEFNVRVVDEKGLSASRRLRVELAQ